MDWARRHPSLAFFITLAMTLTFGWIIGNIVVRSGLSSFIVTLAFLFFLRGVTEVSFRLINQSTQVSGLPDYKEESWFANILGGEVFGWFYDLWYKFGTWMTAGAPNIPARGWTSRQSTTLAAHEHQPASGTMGDRVRCAFPVVDPDHRRRPGSC